MRQLFRDPRAFQVASLSALLAWGLFGLDLEIRPPIALLVLATALATRRSVRGSPGQREVPGGKYLRPDSAEQGSDRAQ